MMLDDDDDNRDGNNTNKTLCFAPTEMVPAIIPGSIFRVDLFIRRNKIFDSDVISYHADGAGQIQNNIIPDVCRLKFSTSVPLLFANNVRLLFPVRKNRVFADVSNDDICYVTSVVIAGNHLFQYRPYIIYDTVQTWWLTSVLFIRIVLDDYS